MSKPAQLGVWVKRFLLEHLVSERNLQAVAAISLGGLL